MNSALNTTVDVVGHVDHADHSQPNERIVVRWVAPELGEVRLEARERIVLGRSSGPLQGPTVSREHAELCRTCLGWQVRDLHSTNGTYVDGVRVTEPTLLRAGSVLRVGEAVAVVGLESETAGVRERFREVMPGFLAGPSLQLELDRIASAAKSDAPITIEGRTGTGKELVARWLHEQSGRQGRFLAVNCATLQEQLVESTLFGHAKGAFSGASNASPGYFRSAHRGSLLLDEILELSPRMQAKLLRVLQEKEVTPVGEVQPIPVDVRVIVTTQRPLRDCTREGTFREDLLGRLGAETVRLPPLCERREEIWPLFCHFVARYTNGAPLGHCAEVVEELCLRRWSLNVRELQHFTQALVLDHDRGPFQSSMLPPAPPRVVSSPLPTKPSTNAPQDEVSRLHHYLRVHDGVVALAARAAELQRSRAYRLLPADKSERKKLLDSFRRKKKT